MPFDPLLLTARDRAQLRLGDVGNPPIIPDDAYDAVLASGVSNNEALAQLAEAIGFQLLALQGAVTLGDQKVDFKEQAQSYFDKAKDFRAQSLTVASDDCGDVGHMAGDCYCPF